MAEGRVGFHPDQALEDFVDAWRALPGVGDWTAHYLALRALGHPDAFPAGDLVLRKYVGGNMAIGERALAAQSEAWRPWRAYAAIHLWHDAAWPAAHPPMQRRSPARKSP